jgi:uncharacterized protein YebE (UPF0316 family)
VWFLVVYPFCLYSSKSAVGGFVNLKVSRCLVLSSCVFFVLLFICDLSLVPINFYVIVWAIAFLVLFVLGLRLVVQAVARLFLGCCMEKF